MNTKLRNFALAATMTALVGCNQNPAAPKPRYGMDENSCMMTVIEDGKTHYVYQENKGTPYKLCVPCTREDADWDYPNGSEKDYSQIGRELWDFTIACINGENAECINTTYDEKINRIAKFMNGPDYKSREFTVQAASTIQDGERKYVTMFMASNYYEHPNAETVTRYRTATTNIGGGVAIDEFIIGKLEKDRAFSCGSNAGSNFGNGTFYVEPGRLPAFGPIIDIKDF